ncbi:MAG TPA: hypothetical protein VFV18_08980 [Porticoccaceae bacterium]|nr:hypothetical protein [Porticoccaceae bacterium]
MNPPRKLASGTLAALLLWCGGMSAARAANLYRYHNDQGVLVIDHSIPAGAAARGYEIIGANGKVIETVAPASAKSTDTQGGNAKADARQQADQEKLDRYLLTSFSSSADIEAVKARKLQEIDRETGIAKARFDELGRKRLTLEERAANAQRGGKPVPGQLLQELEDMKAQMAAAHEQIEGRYLQRAELGARYDGYIRRFTALKTPPPLAPMPPAVPAPAAPTAPATAP